MLEVLPPYPRGRLRSFEDRRVPWVALDEAHHLVVAHEDIVAAHDAQPVLHIVTNAGFIFVSADAGGCGGRWQSWHDGLWICGDEVVGQALKLDVCAADVAELGGAVAGEVGLMW